MADRILIQDLTVQAIIGINPHERVEPQPVLISIALEVDLHPAAASDDIADTVNYATLTDRVVELVEGTHYYLVERLAEEIAALCLQDARVMVVRVRVEKPSALRLARSVGVEIERRRVTST